MHHGSVSTDYCHTLLVCAEMLNLRRQTADMTSLARATDAHMTDDPLAFDVVIVSSLISRSLKEKTLGATTPKVLNSNDVKAIAPKNHDAPEQIDKNGNDHQRLQHQTQTRCLGTHFVGSDVVSEHCPHTNPRMTC